jgi:hypothetical protein
VNEPLHDRPASEATTAITAWEAESKGSGGKGVRSR